MPADLSARLSPRPFRTLLLIFALPAGGMAYSWLRAPAEVRTAFREASLGMRVFGGFASTVALLLLYTLLDRRPRLRIGADGIWTLRVEGHHGIQNIHLHFLNQRAAAIMRAVRRFSEGHGVQLPETEVRRSAPHRPPAAGGSRITSGRL
ncbi:MAG: hypothetical protein EOO11_08810 [Chitinophagaceae bacterium]|nr:MAG: hypothetical protein EOO11_08810 [Chitinophagaceae bacterium]